MRWESGMSPETQDARLVKLKEQYNNGNGAGRLLAVEATRWPSPDIRAHHAQGAAQGNSQTKENPAPNQTGGTTIAGAAENWGSPRVTTNGGNGNVRTDAKARLEDQASMWQTPNTAVASGGNSNRSGDRRGELLLRGQAMNWPSPRAEDSESCGNHPRNGKSHSGDSLTGITNEWRTPNSHLIDGAKTKTKILNRSSTYPQIGLADQIRQWPSPSTHDHKGENGENHFNSRERPHLAQLPNFVAFHFSRPAQTNLTDGEKSSPSRRRLNPLFVEWLMNWPIGWTDFAFAETEWSRWLQQSRSAYSAIVQELFFDETVSTE
jgi:hypothetical protein